MPIGSSSIPRAKKKAQKPSTTPPPKRYTHTTARVQWEETRPSSSGVVESTVPRGVSINDIPGYAAPMQPRAKPRNLTENKSYPLKLSLLPEGMTFLGDIISSLTKMKYEDHDLLLLKGVTNEPYQSVPMIPGAYIL